MSQSHPVSALLQHIVTGDAQNADAVFHALLEARVLAIMQNEDVPSLDAACATCDDDEHAALYEAMKKKAEDDESEDDQEDEDEKEDEGEENEERPKRKKFFGKQSKLDMNKNGALDKQDFKMLRAKKAMSESQRYPLSGHAYHGKSDAELRFISKDAADAARAMKNHDAKAEAKYLDQVNDAATVQHWRKQHGMPDWYKNKYGHGKKSVRESLIDALRDLLTEGPVKRTNKAAKNEFYRRRSNRTARELHHELDDVPMRGWQRDSIEKQIDQHHANPLEAQRARERENTTHTLRGKLTLGSDSNAAMVGRQKMSLADKKKNLKMWQGFRKTSVDHKELYHQPKLPKPVSEGAVKRANKEKKSQYYTAQGMLGNLKNPSHYAQMRHLGRMLIKTNKSPSDVDMNKGVARLSARLRGLRGDQLHPDGDFRKHFRGDKKHYRSSLAYRKMFGKKPRIPRPKPVREQVVQYLRGLLTETGEVKRANKAKKAAWEEKVGKREMLSRAQGLLRRPGRRQNIGVRAAYYGLLQAATSASGARGRKAEARQLRKESLIRNLQNALLEGRIKAQNKAAKNQFYRDRSERTRNDLLDTRYVMHNYRRKYGVSLKPAESDINQKIRDHFVHPLRAQREREREMSSRKSLEAFRKNPRMTRDRDLPF